MTKQMNEESIRVAAYFLWEKAGCPNGRDQEFWHLACEQIFGTKTVSKKCNKSMPKLSNNKLSSNKLSNKKVIAKSATQKATSAKPAVVAKPFYGIKK